MIHHDQHKCYTEVLNSIYTLQLLNQLEQTEPDNFQIIKYIANVVLRNYFSFSYHGRNNILIIPVEVNYTVPKRIVYIVYRTGMARSCYSMNV